MVRTNCDYVVSLFFVRWMFSVVFELFVHQLGAFENNNSGSNTTHDTDAFDKNFAETLFSFFLIVFATDLQRHAASSTVGFGSGFHG